MPAVRHLLPLIFAFGVASGLNFFALRPATSISTWKTKLIDDNSKSGKLIWNLPVEFTASGPFEEADGCVVKAFSGTTLKVRLNIDLLCPCGDGTFTTLAHGTLIRGNRFRIAHHQVFLGSRANIDSHLMTEYLNVIRNAGAEIISLERDDGVVRLFHDSDYDETRNPLVDHRYPAFVFH